MPSVSAVPPSTPSSRDSVVAALRTAGCVFAEDEAGLILATARTPAEVAAMVVTSVVLPFAAVGHRLMGAWRARRLTALTTGASA